MTYYVGDKPADDFVIEPARDLAPFTQAQARLIGPDGILVGSVIAATIDQDDNTITVPWPAGTSPFSGPGVYYLRVTVLNADGSKSERIPGVPIVVDTDATGWHSLNSARDEWDIELPDRTLYELLDGARDECLEFAPVLPEGAPIPVAWRRAQLAQARNVWNASSVSSAGDLGGEGFTYTPRPLDWHVRQLLRPKRGKPSIR